jgi:hypothetical protein
MKKLGTTSSGALLSSDDRYRWRLWRTWNPGLDTVNFIMLNPSTADHEKDDATIKKCEQFVRRWNYGGFVVTNLFAYRATNPRRIYEVHNPVGLGNDEHVVEAAKETALVVCAWGNRGTHKNRASVVMGLLRKEGCLTHCLGVTKRDQPKHPLYLSYSTRLDRFR